MGFRFPLGWKKITSLFLIFIGLEVKFSTPFDCECRQKEKKNPNRKQNTENSHGSIETLVTLSTTETIVLFFF